MDILNFIKVIINQFKSIDDLIVKSDDEYLNFIKNDVDVASFQNAIEDVWRNGRSSINIDDLKK